MTALAAKEGLTPARDFALGVLTERVRQEETAGPPPRPAARQADAARRRTGHLCLLERKHQVEDAIYAVEVPV